MTSQLSELIDAAIGYIEAIKWQLVNTDIMLSSKPDPVTKKLITNRFFDFKYKFEDLIQSYSPSGMSLDLEASIIEMAIINMVSDYNPTLMIAHKMTSDTAGKLMSIRNDKLNKFYHEAYRYLKRIEDVRAEKFAPWAALAGEEVKS